MASNNRRPPDNGSFWSRKSRRQTALPQTAYTPGLVVRTGTFVAAQNPPPTWVDIVISAYDLQWMDLRPWLLKCFPKNPELGGVLPGAMEGIRDSYYIRLPRPLKSDEVAAIAALRLRAKPKLEPPRAYTPDPDSD